VAGIEPCTGEPLAKKYRARDRVRGFQRRSQSIPSARFRPPGFRVALPGGVLVPVPAAGLLIHGAASRIGFGWESAPVSVGPQ